MGPLLLAVAAAALFIAWLVGQPALRERRRKRLREVPFPAHWRAILRERVPRFATLPFEVRRRLEQEIAVFVAEKDFVGCAGQEVDDEVRITIAAQACMLLLGRPRHHFASLATILVYPGAFVVEKLRPEPSGVLQETRQALSGESWTNGQVVLSWQDVLEGAADPADGRNVVIHEFAHQLDQEKGYANGAPLLRGRERYARWSAVLGREYARLQARLAWGATETQPPLINAYGATDPAEFFAVASEVLFERPWQLAAEHPELYSELSAYYRVDPRRWD